MTKPKYNVGDVALNELSIGDRKAFGLIRSFLLKGGKKPTLREINKVTGFKSPRSADLAIQRLIKAGLLKREGKNLILLDGSPKYRVDDVVWYTFGSDYVRSKKIITVELGCSDYSIEYELGCGERTEWFSEKDIFPTFEEAHAALKTL